jgi:hypothetical protein
MYEGYFGDRRLSRRADELVNSIGQNETVVVNRLSSDWNEQIAYYRLLENEKVTLEELQSGLVHRCGELSDGGHKLVIQDTSQFNFQHHSGRIKPGSGLGVIGDNESLGFFFHPSLVIDAESGYGIGFSDIQIWTRAGDKLDKHERDYKNLPIEEKESYRWVSSVENSREVLSDADRLTVIADRESDIFELFAQLPDDRTDLLIRCCQNRKILEGEGKLFEHLASRPCAGTYEIEVKKDLRKGRKGRIAHMEVRYCQLTLLRPDKFSGLEIAEEISIYAIEAKEIASSVPDGEKPIYWRLLTTHSIESFVEAMECIRWYSLRWQLEQLFRLLKLKGFNLEESELQRGSSLMKLCVLALSAALDVMRLMLARNGKQEQPIAHVFTLEEQACLIELAPTMEGPTQKQQNPHPQQTLAWASWIIARLGGWNGYQSQHPPGPITFYRGLKQFEILSQGWMLARKLMYNP